MTQFKHIIANKINQDDEFIANGLTEFANFIYLHGKLETINGYDLCSFVVGNRPTMDGIYNVKVLVDKCTIVYATLFYWKTPFFEYRGLIVMNGDNVQMNYAQRKFDERADLL